MLVNQYIVRVEKPNKYMKIQIGSWVSIVDNGRDYMVGLLGYVTKIDYNAYPGIHRYHITLNTTFNHPLIDIDYKHISRCGNEVAIAIFNPSQAFTLWTE